MKIMELLNDEQDKITGYWAEGHYCQQDFARKCNKYFTSDYTNGFYVQSHKVIKGWLLKYEHPDPDFEYLVEPCSSSDEKAIAATYFFYD